MEEITEAELASAGRDGAVIDGSKGGGKRPVRAAVLRKCCYELKDQIDRRGLRLENAVVSGSLDLAGLAVPFPLRFAGCEFDSPLVVEGAELFELSLTGCRRLAGLLGNGLRIRRDLDLSGCQIAGAHKTSASTSRKSAIWLCEAEIGGRLLCVDTIIDGQGQRAIQADRIRTGGAVRLLHQFTSQGEIRLIGARIGGSVDLTGARIVSSDGPAIDLEDATIEGSVFLIDGPAGRRPEIRGRLDMGSARVTGRLLVRNAILQTRTDASAGSNYASPAVVGKVVNAARLSVGAEVILEGRCEVAGTLDLSRGQMSSLSIGGNCLLRAPGRIALDLTNAELGGDLTIHSVKTLADLPWTCIRRRSRARSS